MILNKTLEIMCVLFFTLVVIRVYINRQRERELGDDYLLCGGFSYTDTSVYCHAQLSVSVNLLCCPLFFQNGQFFLIVQGSVKYVSQQAKQYAHYTK